MLNYPNINPVFIKVFGFEIYWYAIMYILGLLLAVFQCRKYSKIYELSITKDHIEQFIPWSVFAILIGGRLGHVILYQFNNFLDNPLIVFYIRIGGMSFHGGFLGIVIAVIIFSKIKKINFWEFSDLLACSAPIGLFLGRIGNFINMELYGKITDVKWGMVFPNAGVFPRHPTQLYEAFLEGLILWIILNLAYRKLYKKEGITSILFMFFYTLFRYFVEFYREPEGFFVIYNIWITQGQMYSIYMMAATIAIGFFRMRYLMQRRHW